MKTPWRQRAEELLEAGPVTMARLRVEMERAIPPEIALHRRESLMRSERKRYFRRGRTWQHRSFDRFISLERKVEIGRTKIVNDFVGRAVHSGTLERYEQDGVVWIRKGVRVANYVRTG